MFRKIKQKKYISLLMLSILSTQVNFYDVHAYNFEDENKLNTTENNELKNEYLLGEGDLLKIEFEGIDIFSGNYTVGFDSRLDLPEIDPIEVNGTTIDELEKILNIAYKDIIIQPKIRTKIVKYRDVTFHITGEVKRPGLYTIENKSQITSKNTKNLPISQNNFSRNVSIPQNSGNYQIPKLFNALQMSNGVTTQADLSSIEIRRINSQSQGGGKIYTNINLISLLKDGDTSQNIRVYDGDSIIVKKANKPIKKQLVAEIQKSNLSKENIVVYLTGNIASPGMKSLPQGSSLYEAIASAGGKKSLTGNIEFLRFKENGDTDKRVFRFKDVSVKYSSRNPLLYDGDIINIKKNVLGKTTSLINEIGTPVISAYGLYNIFD